MASVGYESVSETVILLLNVFFVDFSWSNWEWKGMWHSSSVVIVANRMQSSLTLALLRCILTEGAVYLDGIDTSTLNLEALRSSITIIPQVVREVCSLLLAGVERLIFVSLNCLVELFVKI